MTQTLYQQDFYSGIELRSVNDSPDYAPHFHDAYTIGLLTQGSQTLSTGRKTETAFAGSVQFHEPFQVHENHRLSSDEFSFQHIEISKPRLLQLLRKEQLEEDIYVVVGKAYQATATVLIQGDDVLLIDGLASREDAEELRYFIEDNLRKRVRLILCTHYMSDHIAALGLFPQAQIVAHKAYLHTFNSQKSLSEEEKAFFVQPTIEISEGAVIRWGRFTLDIFYNPGKTLSSLNVDIPEADLLIVGDEILGNTVFLSAAGVPEMCVRAINRLQSRGRSRVIPGHMGVFSEQSFKNAKSYLCSLQAQVEAARRAPGGANSILEIPIESCLAP